MPRFAHTENIDFRLRKSDKWVRSTEGWEGVRQNGLISLSKCKSYLNDGEMERRDESGLKLFAEFLNEHCSGVRWKASTRAG